jgi:asparagine synthase (glutamine-hydrolysing)
VTRVFAGVFGSHTGVGSGVGTARGSGDAAALASPQLSVRSPALPREAEGRIVLLSGRLRNASELAGELGEPGAGPERVLSLAFDRWGTAMLPRLRGSLALLVWDFGAARGLLAVDQLGAGGLFLHESGGALSFATEVHELLLMLPRRPSPDAASLAEWVVDGQLARGRTLYEGVRRLEGGHAIRLEGNRWREEAYWDPRYAAPRASEREEAVAQLRAGLSRSVARCLAGAGTAGVQVSGGLDSSLVAAFAQELAPSPPTAYSSVYPEHPELDESRWIERVTGALGLPRERLEVRGRRVLRAALEYQHAWGLPAATVMLAFTGPLLRRAATDGVGVLLDGEGGDELLGCSEYVVADRIARLDLRGAVALARRLPGAGADPDARFLWALVREYGLRGAAPHGLHRLVRRLRGRRRYTPSWLQPSAAATYVELHDDWAWKELDGPRAWRYLADLLTAARERMGVFDLLRHESALAGVPCAHPLLEDVDLVELVLRLPPELSLHPLLTRPLAREAGAGVLPDDVRLREDKVDFTVLVVDALSGPDEPLVRALLGGPEREIDAIVRGNGVETILRTPPERRGSLWARAVSRLAVTECWLRSQSDPALPLRLLEEHGDVHATEAGSGGRGSRARP